LENQCEGLRLWRHDTEELQCMQLQVIDRLIVELREQEDLNQEDVKSVVDDGKRKEWERLEMIIS
jgi:hypothetical protein